ncbi:SusC/RagA family TonB-linked outer membrane protein [Olivibacter sp. SDN3]|uniref:SusC/RagA family TonB-linked outer membrane protein n=1 Tax=Olivibacter sp. SDN3 TaxID=2764720 RepID=UPI001651968F|nr:SusC/RagA family TonB-linked outer membrane protein [Olivibacter sp. SDN3]QNL50592.1 SusC/RagA family TonB-linked outer membrane protein [Olivibacter sp. SDN3]
MNISTRSTSYVKKNALRYVWIMLCLIFSSSVLYAQQTITVKGVVYSQADNLPLPGVGVVEKGTKNGVSTNEDGVFVLNNVNPEGTLVFTSIGYISQEANVGNRNSVEVYLSAEVSNLDEVVVVGYGTSRKRDLTGAVSQVRSEVIQNEAPAQMSDMLRGNVAGLSVGYNRNAKGGGSLQLRGRNSLNANTSPLIVLDGAIYYGAWEDINPNDIETVDVLKDASAAAVFGAKSASGVILVTTKKGKEGKPMINYSTNIGLATMAVNQPVHDAETFVPWRQDVMKSINRNAQPYRFDDPRTLPADISIDDWLDYDGSTGDPVRAWLRRLNLQPVEIDNYLAGRSVDWYDVAFQNGLRQDHNISVSGRNKDISYYLGAGYMNNEGIITGDQFKTLRTRANIEANITDFLQVGMSTQFISRNESAIGYGWGNITNLSPWGSQYNADGELIWRPNGEPNGGVNPGYDAFHRDYLFRINSLNTTLFAKIDLPFGFSFRTNFTPQLEVLEQYNHQKSTHEGWAAFGGSAYRRNRQTYYWQLDNILSWNRTFNDIHRFDATFLVNAEKFQRWESRMQADNFDPNDDLGYHGMPTGINPILDHGPDGTGDQYSTGDALMARLVYTLKDRYIFTGTFRRDGYSAFGQLNPRANFGSIAAGWVFSDEAFFNSDWFNYGKLRLSWGSNGNRDIGRYVALANLTTGKYLHVQPDGTVVQVNQLWVDRMRNRNLRWERNVSYNLGLDFALFNNRLDGSLEAYVSNTTDLLVERRLPNVNGFDLVMSNMGRVRNRGIELTLNSNNMQRDNFSWRTTATFQVNRNSIQELYGDLDANGQELDDIQNGWFIGQPIDVIWDWKAQGVYQLGEEEEAARYGLQPGDYKLEDVNDDGSFTNADKQFIGFAEPRFRWSLRNDFQIYKNFTFSFMMYSLWGHSEPFNLLKSRDGFPDRQNSYKYPYWTPDNPSNEWARISSSEGSATGFNVYRKRSFIRLDNVSIAYNLPKSIISRYKVQNLRVYFNVRNAAMYAQQWEFWDPEWNDSDPNEYAGPTPRFFTFGLDLTL